MLSARLSTIQNHTYCFVVNVIENIMQKKEEKNNMNKKTINLIQFVVGIFLALVSAVLMFLRTLPLPARITIGIVGLGLIATSKFRLLK